MVDREQAESKPIGTNQSHTRGFTRNTKELAHRGNKDREQRQDLNSQSNNTQVKQIRTNTLTGSKTHINRD